MIGNFLKQHGPTILAGLGGIGVVATAISAAKASPKAVKLLKQAKEEKGDELTQKEAVQVTIKEYIPTIVIGAATIGCILAVDILRKHQYASLLSAYTLLGATYRRYRNDVYNVLGEELISKVEEAESQEPEIPEEQIEDDRDEILFLDMEGMRYFKAPFDEVVQKVTMSDGATCYVIDTMFADYYDDRPL